MIALDELQFYILDLKTMGWQGRKMSRHLLHSIPRFIIDFLSVKRTREALTNRTENRHRHPHILATSTRLHTSTSSRLPWWWFLLVLLLIINGWFRGGIFFLVSPSSSSLAFAGWLVSWLVDDDGGWGSCYIKGEREPVAIERSKLRKKVMGQSWRQDKSSSSDADPPV